MDAAVIEPGDVAVLVLGGDVDAGEQVVGDLEVGGGAAKGEGGAPPIMPGIIWESITHDLA